MAYASEILRLSFGLHAGALLMCLLVTFRPAVHSKENATGQENQEIILRKKKKSLPAVKHGWIWYTEKLRFILFCQVAARTTIICIQIHFDVQYRLLKKEKVSGFRRF